MISGTALSFTAILFLKASPAQLGLLMGANLLPRFLVGPAAGLLADRLPYQLDHLPLPELVRVIREAEPSRLGSVNRQFRGEIETMMRLAQAAGLQVAELARHAIDDSRRQEFVVYEMTPA